MSHSASTVIETSQATFDDAPLPHSWRWIRVGDISTLVNGDAYKPHEWSTSGVPIIRIQNLNDESKPFNYWSGSLHDRVRVKAGDILLAWSGTPGTSFGAHLWQRGDGVLNQHIFRVDLKNSNVLPTWFVFATNYRLHILIDKAHGGVGLRHVTKGEVEKLEIPLPPVNEQKRLAIALTEQMAAVERARAAALAQLKTAKELPAAYLRDVFDNPEAGQWAGEKLGNVSVISGGIQKTPERKPKNFHRPYLTVRNVQRGYLDLSELERFEITESELDRLRLMQGDILIVEGNGSLDHIGRNALFNGEVTDCIHQNHIIRVRLDEKIFLPEFVSRFLNSNSGKSQMILKAMTTSGLYTLSTGKVATLEIPKPPMTRQREIVEILNKKIPTAESACEIIKDQLETISTLRTALLRQAFTGKL